LDIKPKADSSFELLYKLWEEKYKYFFNYGVSVFTGYTDEEIKWTIKSVNAFQRNPMTQWVQDEFDIRVEAGRSITFEFDGVIMGDVNDRAIRIAMFNLAQSMALDHYLTVSENLLGEVTAFTHQLEKTGRLRISRNNMMRFLGRALNAQNEIAENIYIFDAPELVWDDEYLDKLHQGLIKHFDLRVRFSEVEYTLRTIESNLAVFREIINQRESSMLEVII